MLGLVLVVCGLVLVVGFMLLPGESDAAQRAPFWGANHAHRGLYRRDQSIPENSLAAFTAAVDAGYGIELDIQLSQDGEVVVFHDDTLARMCGVDKRVDELPSSELSRLTLLDTTQRIPLLREVLLLVDGQVPLIVELKRGPSNKQLCESAWRLLRQYDGDICIESFDPRIVRWFRRHTPGLLRGQLAAPPASLGLSPATVLVGYGLANFLGRPHFIAYEKGPKPWPIRLAQRLCMSVVWTARPEDDTDALEMDNDAVIFEFYEPDPRYLDPPAEPTTRPAEEDYRF